MDTLFIRIFNTGLTAIWAVLAVIIIRLALRKAPKRIICMLWALAALRLVLPFSFESVFSLIPSVKTVPENIAAAENPAVHTGISMLNSVINPAIGDAASQDAGTVRNVVYTASCIWAAGVFIMLLYGAVSFLRIKRQVGESVRQPDGSYICDRISSPFILGIFRPKIYIPSFVSGTDTEYVLLHERAHIKRHDNFIKPIGFIILCVYWFNPFVWLGYILLCRDIELACDERVMAEAGGEIKKPYAEALINCSAPRRTVAACPLAFGESGVRERITEVLSYKKPALWVIIAAAVLTTVAAFCLLTNPVSGAEAPAGAYKISDYTYMDGKFSFVMTIEDAPEIILSGNMLLGENYGSGIEEIPLEATGLTADNFDSLTSDDVWSDGLSKRKFKNGIDTVWIRKTIDEKQGIYPYMIVLKKSGELFCVYANMSGGRVECIRWIYSLEKSR